MNEELTVIAACVDKRTGKRFAVGDIFDPVPAVDQAKRLIAAGCLSEEALAVAQGAAKSKSGGNKLDEPTVAEYVAAGYSAANYPPKGYASRSTPEEIAAAVEAEKKAKAEADAKAKAETDAKAKAEADQKAAEEAAKNGK